MDTVYTDSDGHWSYCISSQDILDATNGPIVIEKYAQINIGALIQGPVYIGESTIVNLGAKLRGNISIGI